jgi:pimeloyl-ACP methyl ester carboxylesterase
MLTALKKITFLSFLAIPVTLLLIFLWMNSRQETGDLKTARADAPGSFVDLPDGRVHYFLGGPDTGKLIVMVTGGGITGLEVWGKTIPYFLKMGYRVLAYDLYGRGYSDRPSIENTPELLGRQLKGLLDSLHIKTKFDLIAMSFGAVIALDFVERYPAAVDKIIFLDPTATGEYRISKFLRIPVVSPFVMTVYWYPRAVENQRKEFVNQRLFEEYTRRLHYFMEFKGYKKMTHDTWMYILNQDRLSLLGHVAENKVLVIYGDHDPFFPGANIPLFKKMYPTLKSFVVEGTGHMPHFEKPEVVNPVMGEFLHLTPRLR